MLRKQRNDVGKIKGGLYDINHLRDYCEKNNIILLKEYTQTNRETSIEGKCNTTNCINDFNKSVIALFRSGAYCESCIRKTGMEKRELSCVEKYGVKHPAQNKEVNNKIQETKSKK